jgi:hypothetical protein
MNADYHTLWRFSALQYHNVTTNNPEYQCSNPRLDVVEFTNNSVTTSHLYRQNFVQNWLIIYTKLIYKMYKFTVR